MVGSGNETMHVYSAAGLDLHFTDTLVASLASWRHVSTAHVLHEAQARGRDTHMLCSLKFLLCYALIPQHKTNYAHCFASTMLSLYSTV